LIAVAGLLRAARRGRDDEVRLRVGIERVLRAVGQLQRHPRHHAHDPHAGKIAEFERQQ
jgi:hypothetical protein